MFLSKPVFIFLTTVHDLHPHATLWVERRETQTFLLIIYIFLYFFLYPFQHQTRLRAILLKYLILFTSIFFYKTMFNIYIWNLTWANDLLFTNSHEKLLLYVPQIDWLSGLHWRELLKLFTQQHFLKHLSLLYIFQLFYLLRILMSTCIQQRERYGRNEEYECV